MAGATMRGWVVAHPRPVSEEPLQLVELDMPQPAADELLVKVSVCGVCRTDLHLAEGDLAPRRRRAVPGHEVVGRVEQVGAGVEGWSVGERAGIAWLRGTCGECTYCRRGATNLCTYSVYTGWDADGGYAEYATVPAAWAYRLPERYSDEEAAPLLCAGIIGYRALLRSGIRPGGRLGLYGFGASAHLAAQVALAEDVSVHVMTRSRAAQRLALELGCASAGDAADSPPEPLDAAVLFAPAGDLVPVALEALDRGGTLAVAGIHLSDVPTLTYERHLFYERSLVSVTSSTRSDGDGFLAVAQTHPLRVVTTPYAFDDASRALADLAADLVDGAAVIRVG